MSTLKELVNETASIKNDIVNCNNVLKEKLTSKGVKYVNSDKHLELINKIENIIVNRDIVASDTVKISSGKGNSFKIWSSDSQNLFSYEVANNGTLSLSSDFYALIDYDYRLIVSIIHTRNGKDIDTHTITCYRDNNYNYSFKKTYNVKIGDVLTVYAKTGYTNSAQTSQVKNIQICYDYI